MSRFVYTDFDEFADSIRGLDGRYIPTASSEDNWWIDREPIGQLTVQRTQIGAPVTFAGDGSPDSITVGIPLSDASELRIDGQPMSPSGFIVIRRDRPFTYAAPRKSKWIGLTIPKVLFEDPCFADAAQLLDQRLSETRASTLMPSLRRVSQLLDLLCGEKTPVHITGPQARAAAQEQVLLSVAQMLRDSFSDSRTQRFGRPRVMRDTVLARCVTVFRENTGQPILVGDLCKQVGVSERTLRNVFHEYFGVGPVRFLRARQLHEIRGALLRAQVGQDTVTSVAMRFGVWDFSLFARSYRAMFGEAPSETLRQSRTATEQPEMDTSFESMQSWMNYASLRFEHRLSAADNAAFEED
ncbi:MAG: helix-turn-helix domain-containing protein [Povalibacter sp.]